MKRLVAITALVGAFTASHANLIVNGGFEDNPYPNDYYVTNPTITGWTIDPFGNVAGLGAGYLGDPTQEIDLSGVYDGPNSGDAGAGINQTITDTVGQTYFAKFEVTIPASGQVEYYLDNTLIASHLGTGDYSYTFVGTGSDNLNFISESGNTTHLDNVSVSVPGPAAALVPCFGLGLSFLRRRRSSN
jgi:hypothetical protein